MENKTNPYAEKTITLRENVAEVMNHYFDNLKGEEPRNLYDFFIDEVDEPVLAAALKYTDNNQSETARILGISRGTLRTKMKKFGML